MKQLRVFSLLGIVLLLILGIYFVLLPGQKEKSPILLGYIGVLSGDGSNYGRTEQNAIELALEEINATGRIRGRNITVVYEDGKGTGKDATSAAQKLINIDNVKIILGGTWSSETLAIAPITEQHKVILFSSFSSNSAITKAGDFVFRNSPKDDVAAAFLAELTFQNGYRTSALLSEESDAAQGMRKVFRETFISLGGAVIADENFELGAKDYRTQIIKLKNSSPNVIFLNPQSDTTGGIAIKQIRELGVTVPVYSTYVFSSNATLEIAKGAVEGVIFEDAPGLNPENTKATEFLEKYHKKFGEPASDFLAGARYDSVYILADALRECGEKTNCIRDFLYKMDWYDGVIGRYKFDRNGDVVGIKFAIKKIENGKPILIQ